MMDDPANPRKNPKLQMLFQSPRMTGEECLHVRTNLTQAGLSDCATVWGGLPNIGREAYREPRDEGPIQSLVSAVCDCVNVIQKEERRPGIGRAVLAEQSEVHLTWSIFSE
jgi:hypothetical protein